MDVKPDDAATESSSELAPLLGEKEAEASTSRKDTSIPRSTTGYQSCSAEETITPIYAEEAVPSHEMPPAPEATEQVPIARGAEELPDSNIFKLLHAIFLVLTLAWPMTFLLLGILYFGKCPASSSLPLMAIMTGLSAVVSLLIRIFKVIWINDVGDNCRLQCKYAQIGQDLSFLVSFIVYNCMLYSFKPSNDPSREDYCDAHFYSFNYNANFVSIVFLILYFLSEILPRVKPLFRFCRI